MTVGMLNGNTRLCGMLACFLHTFHTHGRTHSSSRGKHNSSGTMEKRHALLYGPVSWAKLVRF